MQRSYGSHSTTFVASLAAAVLVAGCDGADQEGVPTSANEKSDKEKGVSKNHGGDPKSFINCLERDERSSVSTQRWHDPSLCSNGKFKSKYFHVIYMKFTQSASDPLFEARHAYFKVDEDAPKDDVKCAIKYLEDNKPTQDKCGVFEHGTFGRIRPNFDEMFYGSQQRVYAFIDNEEIGFNPVTPMIFTAWGSHDDQFSSPPPSPKDKNNSFGGAKLGLLGNSAKKGLTYNNYFKDAMGNDMATSSEPETNYSINFNLVMCKPQTVGSKACDFNDKATVIPFAIDPDTGNGRPRNP